MGFRRRPPKVSLLLHLRRNKRPTTPSSSQQSEPWSDLEYSSSTSSSCSLTDEDDEESGSQSESDSESESDSDAEQYVSPSAKGNKQALGPFKKQKTLATPSASPLKSRGRAKYQARAQNQTRPASQPKLAAYQRSNATFSVYVNPTPAPNPKHGPIPDAEFRKATLAFEKDYSQKRRVACFVNIRGVAKENLIAPAPAPAPATGTSWARDLANCPRKPLSVASEHRTNLTTPSVTVASVNGTDAGGSGSNDGNERVERKPRISGAPWKNLYKRQGKAEIPTETLLGKSNRSTKGDDNSSTCSSDESETEPQRYQYKTPTVESASNPSEDSDEVGKKNNKKPKEMAVPGPLNAARSSDLLPPQPSKKPTVKPNPSVAFTPARTRDGSHITANTKDSGYNSSNVSGMSNKVTSCDDRAGVQPFGDDEQLQQQNDKYRHHEEHSNGSTKEEASSYHSSPLVSPNGQRDRRETSAPKRRSGSHRGGPTAAPFDLDGGRFRRQLYEGGVSSLAQEYLGSSRRPPRPSPPSLSSPPPAEQIRMGGYSELAQEYLNPSASRRRRRGRAKFNNSPTANLEDVFYDGNSGFGPSASSIAYSRNAYGREYGDLNLHREDTTSGAQQGRQANNAPGRGAYGQHSSSPEHHSYGRRHGDRSSYSGKSSHLGPYANPNQGGPGPNSYQSKGNTNNHSTSQSSIRLPKLPPQGFVEELPDSDSDSSTIAHIGGTSLAFRSPCSVV
ncbi:hypothetical protein SODALDRAFT_323162 [Sodiomyces alkalinus F11]|uniref:Uncharacterized protein n=1 Tax=Sodiomyces alkalinus (strain CBS 110278 / VKM F-3762 / F11) TaxID=1314773 RepID=A0A3N2PZ87_SODAK|nr:hypothetical protein SODALDRAFT_323162 [Sodiomyces alkalinus F11]ROT39841.1 hypothetical protein SODALDRAFT_323162 [Sodiomyces alkalinus F11]